jgi:hypothetical protein
MVILETPYFVGFKQIFIVEKIKTSVFTYKRIK